MTLDRAVEILQRPGVSWEQEHPNEHYEAEKLGIEAIKLVKNNRQYPSKAWIDLLPGETEE